VDETASVLCENRWFFEGFYLDKNGIEGSLILKIFKNKLELEVLLMLN
jgi:hypothetical protein